MTEQNKPVERVIGLDSHPDTFTACVLRGTTPASAVVEKMFDKVPMANLENWAKKNVNPEDPVLLEASGNSFEIVRRLAKIERTAKVLESFHLGKLKEGHANNDKISAVRIAKAFLAGTAKEVWVPDAKTQRWRDLFHAHRKAVKRNTRACNSLLSYLSDNGVRLEKGTELTKIDEVRELIGQAKQWDAMQWQIIDGMLLELKHTDEQRKHWRSVIAQQVISDPELLAIVRLCGVREQIAFAVGAFIGDIKRFANPKSLVKYFGLNPVFNDSGKEKWSGGIAGGRKDVRSLLIEGAQSVLNSKSPLAAWGRKLLARKGEHNLVVAAVARKMVVAIWYLLNGRFTPVEEIEPKLRAKLTKITGSISPAHLKQMGKTRVDWRNEARERLKTGKVYILDPNKKYVPRATARQAVENVPA